MDKKNLFQKNKKKIAITTALGMILILSVVFSFMVMQKMEVKGKDDLATQIAAVKAELTSLNTAGTISLNVPVELPTDASAGNTYRLVDEYDWMALMVLSYSYDLSDYTFYIDKTVDLSATSLKVAGYPFMGISLNSAYPFTGNLYTTLGENSTSVTVNCALFGYLDASAGINKNSTNLTLDIIVVDATAGLAQVLTGSGTVNETTFANIYIRGVNDSAGNVITPGTIINTEGCAGGIFGQILGSGDSTLIIDALGISYNVASIQGIYAGGIAGKISGNVEMHITDENIPCYKPTLTTTGDVSITNLAVTGASVGSLIGYVEGTADEITKTNSIKIVVEDELVFLSTIQNSYYYAGGLFGYVEYADIEFKQNVSISGIVWVPNELNYYAGGMFGYLGYTNVTVADNCTVTLDVQTNGRSSGGFVAYMVNCDSITIPKLNLKVVVSDCGSMGSFVAYSMYSKVSINELVICKGTELIAYAGYAGGVIGRDEGSYYNLLTVTYESTITVTSKYKLCCVGGFAGALENTKLTLTNSIVTNGNTITSETEDAQGDHAIYVGGMIGKYECSGSYNRTIEKLVTQNTMVYAVETDYPSYVGGVIGAVTGEGTGSITVQDCSATDLHIASASNKMYAGGIVGGNFNDALTITATSENGVKVTFSKDSTTGYFWRVNTLGGILGYATADCSISETEVWISPDTGGTENTYATKLGGVIGVVADTVHVELSDISFTEVSKCNFLSFQWSGSIKVGGIVGEIGAGSILELNNTIDLTNLNNVAWANLSGYYGAIAGYQNNSLIYINPTGYSDGKYTYGLSMVVKRYPDEIGNYGAVYRNGNWDTSDSDMMDTSKWVIQEDSTGTVTILGDTDPYTLATEGDVLRLSIALNTEDVFSGFDTTTYSCATLLGGTYTVTEAIDMSDTGMMTINKNISAITSKMDTYAFKGSLQGSGQASITNSMTAAFQPYLGLFSSIKGATIKDITINTNVEYLYKDDNGKSITLSYGISGKQHAGGIAAYAEGAINLSNVVLNTNIQEESCNGVMDAFAGKKRYLGGAIGYYNSAASTTFTASAVTSNVDINVTEMMHYAGGLIGYVITKDVSEAVLNLSDIKVTGNIGYSVTGNTNDIAKVGGVIAVIGDDATSASASVDTKLNVNLSNIQIQGLQLVDEVSASTTAVLDCGGLVGYEWNHVVVIVNGITVSALNGSTPGISTSMRSSGIRYGGLWHTVNGRMTLETVNIQDININVSSGEAKLSNGLLVGNGQYLYLELNGYTLADNITVVDAGALYLDEIVGFSQGSAIGDENNEECGGIISIVNNTEYDLYDNQLFDQKNPYTRYYYNIATDLASVSMLSESTYTIDSAAEMLQWSLAHYANTPLRQFLKIDTSYNKYGENITFSGAIDLGDISFYPVTVSGGTYTGSDAVITFHGADFDSAVTTWKKTTGNTASGLLYIYEEESEHYRLHSGVFYDLTTSTIQNLTLTGSVTAMSVNGIMYSGGLVAGSIYGVKSSTQIEDNAYIEYETTPTNIYNITLDDFSVSHLVDDSWASYYGVLISRIDSGATVNIGYENATNHYNGVTMTGYTGEAKVAAALIGQVGHATAEGINLSFVNMQVADVADTVTVPSGVGKETAAELAGAQVLAYASFIYDYYYQLDNTKGIYIFYLKDYQDKTVTLGEEIGNTVQFYDDALVTPIKEYTADSASGCLVYVESNYKPYVYQSHGITPKKEIDVNPKTGNITEGCGTYDDPYVISNPNQLMTLYKYLKDYTSYEKSLKGWEINAFGVDAVTGGEAQVVTRTYMTKKYNIGELLDADDKVTTVISDYEALVTSGFPSVEQLSNAYYVITADMELSDATDFTGLGTELLPFTGVFVGQALDDESTLPTIRMPKTTTNGGEVTYGFIKYAKGAVVSNLNMELGYEENQTTDSESGETITEDAKVVEVAGTGAGVMAIVLGGDNVIDGVTVSGVLTVGSDTIAAGYVGELRMGSVILRNITETSLSNFTISSTDGTYGKFQKVFVGKIKDGFVVDDDGTFAKNYTARSDIDATDTLNVVDVDGSFNGTITDSIAFMDKSDTITVSQTTSGGYQYQLDSAQDLLVLAFAINSGAMNYMGDETYAYTYGYDEYSRSRITDYSYVGEVTIENASSVTAYLHAIQYDNCNPYTKDGTTDYLCGGVTYNTTFYHPYVFEYFSFIRTTDVDAIDVEILQGTTLESDGATNLYITESSEAKSVATYELAAGTYDMSALTIKKCFKGIGARSNTNLYSLRGNFIGVGSNATSAVTQTTIKIDLDITTYSEASLFTKLHNGTYYDVVKFEMGGFNLAGTVINTKTGTDGNDYVSAAGLATSVFVSYDFFDICVQGMTIKAVNKGTNGTNYAAGLLVRTDGNLGWNAYNTVRFTDCMLDAATVISADDCGGLVTIDQYSGYGTTFTRCVVKNSDIKNYISGHLGGFMGSNYNPATFIECDLVSSNVKTLHNDNIATIESNKCIGGYVGYSGQKLIFIDCDILMENAVVSEIGLPKYLPGIWNNDCGGYVGRADKWASDQTVEMNNCDIEALNINQKTGATVGGYIGKSVVQVLINQAEGASSTVKNVTEVKNFNQAMGGLIGAIAYDYGTYESKIKNVDIIGMDMALYRDTGEPYIGGVVGSIGYDTELENVRLIGTQSQPTLLRYSAAYTNTINMRIGGMVGAVTAGNMTFKQCSVLSLDDTGAETDECYLRLMNGRYTGGIVGTVSSLGTVNIQGTTLSDILIQADYMCTDNTTVSAPHAAGGGVVALQTAGTMNITDTTIDNVQMINYSSELASILGVASDATECGYLETTKNGMHIVLGGIAGLVQGTLNVQGFDMKHLSIGSDGYVAEAGSVAGLVYTGTLNISQAEEDGALANKINDSTIIGGNAGGIIGNVQKNIDTGVSATVNVADITLDNMTVLAKNLSESYGYYYAGGITGRHNRADTVSYYEKLTMTNSVVATYSTYSGTDGKYKNTYIGGFIGELHRADIMSYDITLQNVLMGQLELGSSNAVVPVYSEVVDGTTKLYATKVSYTDSELSYSQEEITTGSSYVSKEYTMNMGTFTGYSYEAPGESYVIRANVDYSENLECFHPGIDVGMSVTEMEVLMANDTLDIVDAYKLYREKYHIIYRDDFDGAVSDGFLAEQLSLADYYFDQLDEVYDERFAGQIVNSNMDYRLEENYLQGDETSNYAVNDVLEESYRMVSEDGKITYLAPYTDANGVVIPMLTASGNYHIDTVINTAINILTNNGGASGSVSDIMEVSIVRYQLSEDYRKISLYASQEPVITYTDGVFAVSEDEFDTITNRTFNLISIKYKYSDTQVYELQIPVFVREMLSIETHMKAMEGSHYLLDNVPSSGTEPKSGYTQINVELQSVYTIYSEFIYSSARAEYASVEVEKSIYRKNNAGDYAPFEVGTKITLLDITGNNMAYYYEVTEKNQKSVIKFSEFKSIWDESYINADLGKNSIADGAYAVLEQYLNICNQEGTGCEEVGLEQFLIIIDESRIVNVPAHAQYNVFVRAEEEDNETLFKNAKVKEPCYVIVNEIPGLYQLVAGSSEYALYADSIRESNPDGNTSTYLTEASQISRDGSVQLIGSAYIISPITVNQSLPNYWVIADESSRERYMELAVSLVHAETNERVAIPEGTKIQVVLNGESYGDLFAYQTEYLYCYYDMLKNSGDESDYVNLNDLENDLIINFDISFDFTSATDFSEISEANYYMKVELLGTSDYAYPRSGDTEDYVNTGVVKGINKKYLGFALETEEMLTLGMNDYNSESSDSGRIGITSRLDFSDYLDSDEGKAELKAQFEGKYFTYTYVIERKVKSVVDGVTSYSYTNFGYVPNAEFNSLIRIFDDDVSLANIPSVGTVDDSVIICKTVQYEVDIMESTDIEETVTQSDEDSGTEPAINKVISRDNPIMEEEFTLFADVPQLMENINDITNYRVTCYVTVTDTIPDVSAEAAITTLVNNAKENYVSDFFIFTVARLKTDMD